MLQLLKWFWRYQFKAHYSRNIAKAFHLWKASSNIYKIKVVQNEFRAVSCMLSPSYQILVEKMQDPQLH